MSSDFRAKALRFLVAHLYPVIGGIAGLVMAILMLIIGFFPALLLFVMTLIGTAAGVFLSVFRPLKRYFPTENDEKSNYVDFMQGD